MLTAHVCFQLLLNGAYLVFHVVLVLLLSFTFREVHFFTELAAHILIDVSVRADRVVCQQKQQMQHAHVRIAYSNLLHWLRLERLHQVFHSGGALRLIVHDLLLLQCSNHAPHIVLVRVLERVVLDVLHDEVLCD